MITCVTVQTCLLSLVKHEKNVHGGVWNMSSVRCCFFFVYCHTHSVIIYSASTLGVQNIYCTCLLLWLLHFSCFFLLNRCDHEMLEKYSQLHMNYYKVQRRRSASVCQAACSDEVFVLEVMTISSNCAADDLHLSFVCAIRVFSHR